MVQTDLRAGGRGRVDGVPGPGRGAAWVGDGGGGGSGHGVGVGDVGQGPHVLAYDVGFGDPGTLHVGDHDGDAVSCCFEVADEREDIGRGVGGWGPVVVGHLVGS